MTGKVDLILRKGAAEIHRTAVLEVITNAFDTGHLAASISWAKLGVANIIIYTDVDYAGYVHDGTEKMSARPFFVWAFDAHVKKVERALEMLLEGSGGYTL